MVISDVDADTQTSSNHFVQTDDGKTALRIGAIDDIWELGKPIGTGGPCKNSSIAADVPSDPYLMTGYDRNLLNLYATDNCFVKVKADILEPASGKPERRSNCLATPPLTMNFQKRFRPVGYVLAAMRKPR